MVQKIKEHSNNKLNNFIKGFYINKKVCKDLIDYFNTNWFHPIVDSYLEKKQELNKSKQLYQSGDISFFDYFIKRLEVYDFIQEKNHMKHYEGVDRKKYIDILRSKFRLILR